MAGLFGPESGGLDYFMPLYYYQMGQSADHKTLGLVDIFKSGGEWSHMRDFIQYVDFTLRQQFLPFFYVKS